jgi:hypothetical protein
MPNTAVDVARERIAARPAREHIAAHLRAARRSWDSSSNTASQRVATAEPLSVLDGHTVLVTEFVAGVAPEARAAAIREDRHAQAKPDAWHAAVKFATSSAGRYRRQTSA